MTPVSDKAVAVDVKAPATAAAAQVSGKAQAAQTAEVTEEALLQQFEADQVGEDPVAVIAEEEGFEQASSEAVVAEAALDLTQGLAAAEVSNAGQPARAPVDGEKVSALQDGDDDGGISPVLLGVLGLAAIGGTVVLVGGGASNKPPVATDDTFAANEGSGTANFSVATNDTDPNRKNTLTFAASGTLPAGVSLSSSGAVTFDSNNAAYNSLAAGQTQVLTFSYTVTDNKGASDTGTVTLTVTGTNDVPVAVADVGAATEGAAALTGSVRTNDTDPDTNDVLSYTLAAPVAGLTLNTNGTFSFDPANAAYNNLSAGQTRVVVANYTVSDGRGGSATSTLTITVTGTNDVPVAVADVAAATEGAAVVTGSVATNDSDVDANDTLTYALNAPVAGLTLNPNGTFSFDPSNAAYNSLAAGQAQSVVANYTVSDGRGGSATSTLTITVTGTNDLPVAVADVAAATEDAAVVTGSVRTNDSDVDATDVLTYALDAPVAGLTLNANGTYSFDPSNAAYQSLAAGQTRVVVANITVNDGNGGVVPTTLTITVTGTNDVPVAVADVAAATEDGAVVTGSVRTNDSDVDATDVLTYALVAPVAGLTLNANGTYSFDPSNAAYQSLAVGETRVVVANITVNDGNGGVVPTTLTITVTGTNDAPVAVADVAAATEGGAAVTGSVATNDTDVDATDVLTYTLNAPVAGLTLNANGTFSFDPTNAAYDSLAAGQTLPVVANYTVSDGKGGTATSTLTITVTGTNDAPVITTGATATVAENAPVTTVVYDAAATDVDATDVITFSLTGADAALFTINSATGEVRLVAPANFERRSSLSFTVVATDSITPSLSASRDVTVTVNNEVDILSLDVGTLDAPVTINAGIQAGDLIDTDFRFVETSGTSSQVNIINFGANDFIFFDGSDPADYTFQNDGNGNLTISSVGGDGEAVNVITLANIGIASNRIVVTEADAEAALAAVFGPGNYFRGSATPVTIQTTGNPAINAAGRAATIIEDLGGPESSSVITNFRSDDILRLINGPAGQVSFTTGDDPRDLRIDYVDAATGNVSTVILDNVLRADGPIVFNEATAEAAVALVLGAGDYFQFG
jgi:VCBS repeat-containing protein